MKKFMPKLFFVSFSLAIYQSPIISCVISLNRYEKNDSSPVFSDTIIFSLRCSI